MQRKGDSFRHQLRSTIYVFLFLALIIFSVEAISAETASILPKKVSRFRVVGVQTGAVTERLNSNGRIEPITSSLNRSLTAADLAKQNPKLQQLVDGVKKVDKVFDRNYADSLVTSNLYSNFDLQATQVMPCYEYGISDKWNLGIRIPIVRRVAHASFSASTVNNANAVKNNYRGVDKTGQLDAGLAQLAAMNLDTNYYTQSIFTSKGYDAPHNFESTDLGDIEVGGKYLIRKSTYHVSSIQTGLRLPTGKRKSRTNIFDSGTGNGTWATGAYLFNDFYPKANWIVGTAFKGIYNLPDKYVTAVPRDENDSLPSNLPQDGQVQQVSRVSGMEYNAELSSTLRLFNSSVAPWIAYQWFQHGVDKYSGTGNLYYAGLEKGTDFTRHAFEIGAGYSTVSAYVAKKAKIPYSIEALYNRTFAGRNASYVSYGRVDLISYF